ERLHFEFLLLETQQAGLSWRTILGKREAYRRAFAGFDPVQVVCFGERDIARLLEDSSIVRNRRKLEGAVANARAFLEVASDYGSFDAYLWAFVDGEPIVNAWDDPRKVPVTTPLSDRLSGDLKARGFKFVGSTTIYAHMQAVGLVNDHLVDCFRWAELGGKKRRRKA
ncbi:MAG: DNA-3-methyladenine glycosylase I, partial [Spirochaetaceae bacterium]|nr:DNA-3-methyladenine glycosylase I [Spirochaetaceae bacterium]